MNLTLDQNKQLIKEFPFLRPCNVWTGELYDDYNYSYINGIGDLPRGWDRLFLLYCKYLKIELNKYDYITKFRFLQIKEKYGSMRLYNNGYPRDSKVSELDYIFEHLSTYICEDCGKVATYETPGWITVLCEGCYKNSYQSIYIEDPTQNKIGRKSYFVRVRGYNKDLGYYKMKYDCRPYWKEYLALMKLNDDEFIKFIMETSK